MPPSPFTIDVPDSVLEDLRARLARTRLPPRTPGGRWVAGTDPDYLRELLAYWAGGFDWRAREQTLNAVPHYRADIDGRLVHYIHVPGVGAPGGPPPLPLLLTHGWPSTFAEMLPLVSLLTDPGRHGGDPADAFDVVVPSLPGHIFSDLPPAGPVTRPVIADALARLMTDVLGYQRFGAYGGDIGADVTNWLAIRYPDRVVGIHLIHPKLPTTIDPDQPLSAAEQAYLDRREVEDEADGGTLAAHASLVAREYGIPAVVATGDATTRLDDGQVVTVDGSAGTIQPPQ